MDRAVVPLRVGTNTAAGVMRSKAASTLKAIRSVTLTGPVRSWVGRVASGLEISHSAFCFPRKLFANVSMLNLQVIRNLFQQIPMSDMSMVDCT